MFKIDRWDGKGFTSVLTDREEAMNYLMEYIRFNGTDRYQRATAHATGGGWQVMVFGKKKPIQELLDEAITGWLGGVLEGVLP